MAKARKRTRYQDSRCPVSGHQSSGFITTFRAWLFKACSGRLSYHESALGQGNSRNTVSPPKLTADAPVVLIFHPVAIGILVFGMKFNLIILYRSRCYLGQIAHLQEPLHGEFGSITTLVRPIAYLVVMVLPFFQQIGFSGLWQICLRTSNDPCPHTFRQPADGAVIGIKDINDGQIVFLAQHIVVDIVGRGYLQATGTELHIHIFILNDGYHAIDQRYNHLLPLEPSVLGVLRIDAHGRVTHDGFRTVVATTA